MQLEKITMPEFISHLKKTKTIIIPFGAVEEHGSHLPLCTDTLTVDEVLRMVTKKKKVFLAPTVNYGVMLSNKKHPGSLGISSEALRRVTTDIIRDAYEKGLRNFLLISGHGGRLHMAALKEAAETLIEELDETIMAVFCLDDVLIKIRGEISETKNDSHSGELETSMMLSLAPGLVKGRSKEEYPNLPDPFVVRDKVKYWPGGVWGDPSKATIEKGEKAIRFMVDEISGIIDTIEKKKL